MEGTGFLGAHDPEVYRVEADDLYLVGTSEVPLAAYHSGEVLDLTGGPRRYAGFSACFRREAGSYGKDTRGVFRVHWFDKVEGLPHRAGTAVPGGRHRGRRPRLERGPQVRLRGLVPVPGSLPRADLDVELHHLPGPPARHPLPRRGG